MMLLTMVVVVVVVVYNVADVIVVLLLNCYCYCYFFCYYCCFSDLPPWASGIPLLSPSSPYRSKTALFLARVGLVRNKTNIIKLN